MTDQAKLPPIDPASPLYRSLMWENQRDPNRDDIYDREEYRRQDRESRSNISNHDMTEDQRLDDPRHGQGKRK